MPTYDYKCRECGNVQEEMHTIKLSPEEADIHCNKCGAHPMERLISGGCGFVLKGEGFPSKKYRVAGQMRRSQEKAEKQQALNWDSYGKSTVVPNAGGLVTGEAGDPEAWRKAGKIAQRDMGAAPEVVKQYEEKARECENQNIMPDHLKTARALPLGGPSKSKGNVEVSGSPKTEEKSIDKTHTG